MTSINNIQFWKMKTMFTRNAKLGWPGFIVV